MSVQTVSSIAVLKTVTGTTHEVAEVLGYYAKNDGGGGKFYWDSLSTDTDNGGTIIQSTGVPTGRWLRIVDNKINVKWFGATGDGSTDDSVAVNKALSMIEDGFTQNVYFPSGDYKVTSAAQTIISNKSNFNILMDDDARIINTDYSTDFVNASATFVGTLATFATSSAHGYSSGNIIIFKDFTDNIYDGSYTITVTSSTTFTAVLSRTPDSTATGKIRILDISKFLLTLNTCTHANLKINFYGTVQDVYTQNRLGWTPLKLQDNCSHLSVKLRGEGMSYGIWSGEYDYDHGGLNNSYFDIDVTDVGYPVALWKSGDNSIFDVNFKNAARGVFASAVNNSIFNVRGENYLITGAIFASQRLLADSSTYGCDNITINFKNVGANIYTPLPRRQYCVFIGGYPFAGDIEMKNFNVDIECSGAKYTTPLYIRTYDADHKVSNINISALIDRRELVGTEIAPEFTIGAEDAVGEEGIYSGINFKSWIVYNPDGNTVPFYFKFANLLDDINFANFHSNAPRSVFLPAGRRINYPMRFGGITGSPNSLHTGALGDAFIDKYAAIDAAIYLKYSDSGNTNWHVPQPIIWGTTAQRPTLTASTKGFMYFDTDLGIPIWWTGSSWTYKNLGVVTASSSSASFTPESTYIECNATSGAIVATLPDVTTCKGKKFTFMKTDLSTNTVTVTPVSSQTISLSSTVILRDTFSRVEIYSNGASWRIVNYFNTVITANNTDVVTTAFLNTNYPFADYPIGTIVYYSVQNKKFERISSTVWVSIATVLP